jgi:hypothetical protein
MAGWPAASCGIAASASSVASVSARWRSASGDDGARQHCRTQHHDEFETEQRSS